MSTQEIREQITHSAHALKQISQDLDVLVESLKPLPLPDEPESFDGTERDIIEYRPQD